MSDKDKMVRGAEPEIVIHSVSTLDRFFPEPEPEPAPPEPTAQEQGSED